ncbi:MAG TPA: ABC transporter substrate-binding protein, partial [Pseudomonas sp.]|nr:ABC transporter substrate-binding protein [Pseudomonas sp.]
AVQPVSRAALDEQQRIADAFHAATLLPAPVDAGAVDLWCPTVP